MGGTGIGYKVIWEEVPTGTRPFDPGNKIDVKAQQYNDPNSGMKKTLDSNVSRIQEMLYGSGAGDQVAQFAELRADCRTVV